MSDSDSSQTENKRKRQALMEEVFKKSTKTKKSLTKEDKGQEGDILRMCKETLRKASQCKVSIESFIVDYVNKKYVEATGTTYDYNENKRVNYTVTWKIDLPEDTKLTLKVKKWVKDDYKLLVFNIEKRLRNMLEMDAFGIQTMCLEYTRPPAVWPLQKNVPYVVSNWYVDGSRFPPNLPIGKWLAEQSFILPNRTVMLTGCITIQQENFTTIIHNPHVADNINGYISEKLYVNFSVKVEMSPDTKLIIKVLKNIKGGYMSAGINMALTLPEVLRIDMLGLQDLFKVCFKPPLVWPIKKYVLYQCRGWEPEPKQIPRTLPTGHYRVDVLFTFSNSSKFGQFFWDVYLRR
ncbi:hypothetical protein FQR65_LT08931 [Abscondita terminalis]|nr:hypothetical protein FQR65_LT08931 [Abscondita terminalis]